MNPYNPYYYNFPAARGGGIFSRLFGGTGASGVAGGGMTMSKFFNGARQAIGFANQAIPVIKEARPIINNARTIFKISNQLNKAGRTEVKTPTASSYTNAEPKHEYNNPKFFA